MYIDPHPLAVRFKVGEFAEIDIAAFAQLCEKVGEEKAMAMLEKAEEGFKENYALLKKLSEM